MKPEPQKQLETMLEEHGFELVRQNTHLVYKNPEGKVFVTSKTPSDFRAALNNVSYLKKVLATKSQSKSLPRFEAPTVQAPPQAKEPSHTGRQLGLTKERYERRYKPPKPQPVRQINKDKQPEVIDIYHVGSVLRRTFKQTFDVAKWTPNDCPDWHEFEPDKKLFMLQAFGDVNRRIDKAASVSAKLGTFLVKKLREQKVLSEARLTVVMLKEYASIFPEETLEKLVLSFTAMFVHHYRLFGLLSVATHVSFETDKIRIHRCKSQKEEETMDLNQEQLFGKQLDEALTMQLTNLLKSGVHGPYQVEVWGQGDTPLLRFNAEQHGTEFEYERTGYIRAAKTLNQKDTELEIKVKGMSISTNRIEIKFAPVTAQAEKEATA